MTSVGAVASARLRPVYWRLRYAAWRPRNPRTGSVHGYAVLVPVPGDLPVLADVALTVLRAQLATNRVETIVIPDLPSPAVAAAVERHQDRWDGPLRLLELAAPERALLPRLGDPAKNHPAQLLRGTTATGASHVIFHDADLFPLDDDLHEQTWSVCAADDVDVAGIEGPWDPWFAEQGRGLVATWEMCCRVSWLRAFPPWRHFGHESRVAGGRHVFDTTFWPQWSTDQDRLRNSDTPDRFIHFNYVISTYRKFQRAPGPFRDEHFRLLLLRVLIDSFDGAGGPSEIPSLADLERGIDDPGRRVYYDAADAPLLLTMAGKLRMMLSGRWSAVNTDDVLVRLGRFEDWAAQLAGRSSRPTPEA